MTAIAAPNIDAGLISNRRSVGDFAECSASAAGDSGTAVVAYDVAPKKLQPGGYLYGVNHPAVAAGVGGRVAASAAIQFEVIRTTRKSHGDAGRVATFAGRAGGCSAATPRIDPSIFDRELVGRGQR